MALNDVRLGLRFNDKYHKGLPAFVQTAGHWAQHVQKFNMVLGEGEISQPFGSIRLVGGESLVSQRTVFSRDSK